MSCTQLLLLKKSEMWWRSGSLYSQMPLPFWRAMAGCIGSRAAAEPLVHFFCPARTNGRAVPLRNYKRLQLKRKKIVFHIQASSMQYSFHISGNWVYESNRVHFPVIKLLFHLRIKIWKCEENFSKKKTSLPSLLLSLTQRYFSFQRRRGGWTRLPGGARRWRERWHTPQGSGGNAGSPRAS